MSKPKPDYWTKMDVDWLDLTVLGASFLIIGVMTGWVAVQQVGGLLLGWSGLTVLRVSIARAWRDQKEEEHERTSDRDRDS